MALSLAGKTAIVTGAGSGINLEFARILLNKKCNVIFADLSLRPEAQELVDAHSSSSNGSARAIFQKTDVTDWQQLEAMFSTATEHFGGADIVCPGAGVFEPPWSNFWYPPGKSPSTDKPTSSSYRLLDINITHPIRTTQLAIAHFTSSKNPSRPAVSPQNPRHIIHISSVAGQTTSIVPPMYNASKHAINGFVRSLAPLDKALGIRVTAVAPGVIKTPLWTDNPEKLKLVTSQDVWVTAEHVAEMMVELVEKEEVEVADGEDGQMKTVKVEGGFILEVAKPKVRKVEAFMDPGPSKSGGSMAEGLVKEQEEILERLKTGDWGA